MKNDNDKKCSIETALTVLSAKWKILILWYLKDEALRFNQLRKKLSNVTPKILVQKLRELEKDGLIIRKVYPEIPPKVEYSLSEYGQTVKPLLKQLYLWGEIHKNNI